MIETGAPSHARRRPIGYVLVTLIAVFVVHGNTITDTFLADDNRILMQIEAGGPFARWTGPPDVFLRPLVSLLFATDLWIYGLNPRGFHVTNLLLHAGIALWVMALGGVLARRAAVPRSTGHGLGLLAGGIFLMHPSHSESVAWIAGRSDLLATVFALGAVVLYLRWREHIDRPTDSARPTGGLGLRVGSWLLLVAALASKEAAATIPGVLIALDLLGAPRRDVPWPRAVWNAIRHAWWHWATIPVYLIIRAQVIQQTIGGYGTTTHMKLDLTLLGQHFIAFLSRATLPRFGGEQVHDLVFVGLVIAAAFVVWVRCRRDADAVQPGDDTAPSRHAFLPVIGASIAAFGVAVLPALSLSISRTSSASERLVYLPSALTAVASAALIFMLLRSLRARWLVGTLIVASLAIGSVLGNISWREAARASKLAVDAILAIDTEDRIYVLTIPGAIDGAHALHNNLIAALRLRRPGAIKLVAPIRVSLPSISTPLEAIRKKAKRFIVASSDPGVRFQRHDHELYKISHRRRTGFRVDLPELKRGDWVIAWSNGEMIVVKEGSMRTPSR